MIDALRYEWVRIRTIRSTWWLTGIAVVLGLGITLLLALVYRNAIINHADELSPDDLSGLGAVLATQLAATGAIPSLVAFLLAMVGIFGWGHEYRHGMIRASLTALPDRATFWTAKYAVVGAWVAVVHLAIAVGSALLGWVFLHGHQDVLEGQTWQVIGWQVLSTVLLTWLAMAFTQVTRSQAFALVAIFLWPLLIESLINVVFQLVPGLKNHTDVLRFLPFSAQRRMVDVVSDAHSTFGDPLTHLGGAIVFGAVTAILMGVGFALFTRRDA